MQLAKQSSAPAENYTLPQFLITLDTNFLGIQQIAFPLND